MKWTVYQKSDILQSLSLSLATNDLSGPLVIAAATVPCPPVNYDVIHLPGRPLQQRRWSAGRGIDSSTLSTAARSRDLWPMVFTTLASRISRPAERVKRTRAITVIGNVATIIDFLYLIENCSFFETNLIFCCRLVKINKFYEKLLIFYPGVWVRPDSNSQFRKTFFLINVKLHNTVNTPV